MTPGRSATAREIEVAEARTAAARVRAAHRSSDAVVVRDVDDPASSARNRRGHGE